MQIKPHYSCRLNFKHFAFVAILLLGFAKILTGQAPTDHYGVDDLNPDEFRFLRDSPGGNFALVELPPDSSAWKTTLEEAEKYGVRIVIWPPGNSHHWTPWACNGSSWDITEGINAMKYAESYVNSGGTGLLATIMSHEPFYINGDPYTTSEMQLLYSELKNSAPHVVLFVYMNDIAYYDPRSDTKIEDGLMDIAGILLY